MHQMSANRVLLKYEAMQAVPVMHLWTTSQLTLEQFIELGRICLAFSRLHHLADEEAEQLILSGTVVGELFGIGGDHSIDHAFDRARVGNRPQTLGLDDGVRRLAL